VGQEEGVFGFVPTAEVVPVVQQADAGIGVVAAVIGVDVGAAYAGGRRAVTVLVAFQFGGEDAGRHGSPARGAHVGGEQAHIAKAHEEANG